jgi:cAMP-dependent protein kinase regulator/cGMP-dependent protein kinase 2
MLAVISKGSYQKVLQSIDMKADEQKVQFFKQVPFMKLIHSRVIKAMHLKTKVNSYKRNQVVMYQGDPSDFMCIVKKG